MCVYIYKYIIFISILFTFKLYYTYIYTHIYIHTRTHTHTRIGRDVLNGVLKLFHSTQTYSPASAPSPTSVPSPASVVDSPETVGAMVDPTEATAPDPGDWGASGAAIGPGDQRESSAMGEADGRGERGAASEAAWIDGVPLASDV